MSAWEPPRVLGGGDPRPLLDVSFALARELAASGVADGIDLYGGQAGIGWVLARASALTGDRALAAAAAERLQHVASAAGATTAVGLADGLAGIAFALLDGGEALRDEPLQAAGRAVAARIAETVGDADADYLTGLGGAIALLATSVRTSRVAPALLDAARAAGERVVDTARRTPWGWGWDVPGLDAVPALCGMAHGSAGMAVALHELAAGDPRWAEPADQALRYVRAHFRRASGGWPDLRVAALDDRSLDASCGTSWCHGSAGIGLAFLRIHELTGDRGALADASAALQATRRGVWALSSGANVDASLCHGTGGNVELYASAAEILGGHDHLRAARRVAQLAVDVSRRAGGRWTAGDERDPDAPGLFLGQAGVIAWLLRAVDPTALPSPLLLR